jgi:hypothetical protein
LLISWIVRISDPCECVYVIIVYNVISASLQYLFLRFYLLLFWAPNCINLVYPCLNCEVLYIKWFRSLICMYLFPPYSLNLLRVLFALSFGCSLVQWLMNQELIVSCLYPTSISIKYVKITWRFRCRDLMRCHQPPQHALTSPHDVKLKTRSAPNVLRVLYSFFNRYNRISQLSG